MSSPRTDPHDGSKSPSLGLDLSMLQHGPQQRQQEMEQVQTLHRASTCSPSDAAANPNVFADEYAIDDSAFFSDVASEDGRDEPNSSSPASSTSQLSTSSPASGVSTAPTAPTAAPSHTDERFPQPHLSPLPQSSPHLQTRQEARVNRSRSQKGPRPTSGSYASMHSPSVQSLAPSADDPFNPQRSMSSASSGIFARSHSPFQPGQGPSHPYAMYPQNAGRTSSIATTSTLRSHGATLPSGPSFPYALYTQHDFDSDDPSNGFQNPIPLGFNGHFHSFRRQIGPEGEELDIIGPDGHTEQLPPYSRFPDSSPTARSPTHMPAIGETPQDSLAAEEAMQPATRHVTSASHRSHRSHESSDWETTIHGSTLQGSSSNGELTEKTWLQKSWREKRNTVVCGCMPVWAMWLLLLLLVVIAIIIGACVGYLNAQHNGSGGDAAQQTVTVTKTQLVDATPLPSGTMSAYKAMQTGPQEVDLAPDSNENFNTCITDFHQAAAWNCNMASSILIFDIQPDQNSTGPDSTRPLTVQISTQPASYAFPNMATGELPLNLPPMKLATVIDTDAPQLGPALHFQAIYNKVVILPLDDLGGTSFQNGTKLSSDWVPTSRRRWVPPSASDRERYLRQSRDAPTSSDYYWSCVFDETFIEVFIYLDPSAYTPAPMTSPSVTTPPPSSTETSSTSQTLSPYEQHQSTRRHARRDIPIAQTQDPVQATAVAIPSSYAAIAAAEGSPSGSPSGSPGVTATSSSATTAPTYPVYPILERRVKIEERRIRGSPHGVCTLKQYLNNGQLNNYPENSPAIANILENDPLVPGINPRRLLSNGLRRRSTTDNPSDSCHCQWEN